MFSQVYYSLTDIFVFFFNYCSISKSEDFMYIYIFYAIIPLFNIKKTSQCTCTGTGGDPEIFQRGGWGYKGGGGGGWGVEAYIVSLCFLFFYSVFALFHYFYFYFSKFKKGVATPITPPSSRSVNDVWFVNFANTLI